MDYGLADGDETQGVREGENSEWGGKTSGVSATNLFPAWLWARMTLVKEKFPNRFAQFWSHQAGEKQPNTTKQAGKSRELKLIIKMNKLFVSFSIWHRGFELLRWKLYLGGSRDFMATLNQVLGSVRSWQSDVGMCCSDMLCPPGCSQEKLSFKEFHQKITFGKTKRAGWRDFLIPF